MLLALLFVYHGYKKANETNRNGVLWGFIALVAFIGSQLIVGLLLGGALGIGNQLFGWSDTVFEDYDILFRILGVIAGLTGGFLVLKYLGRIPQKEIYTVPPSPPNFDR